MNFSKVLKLAKEIGFKQSSAVSLITSYLCIRKRVSALILCHLSNCLGKNGTSGLVYHHDLYSQILVKQVTEVGTKSTLFKFVLIH